MFSLRVMSFNIRYGTASDGLHVWSQRRALVVERIRAFNPDWLGLQECRDDEQAAYLREQLPEYTWLAVRRGGDSDSRLEMAPLLYRSAEFEAVASGHFWLSETPAIPGSLSWGGAHARTVTWARLQPRRGHSPTLIFINTHLDYLPEATLTGAQQLRRFIDTFGAPTPLIVTGDFNAAKDSAPYTTLLSDIDSAGPRLVDVYRACHGTEAAAGTYHVFGALQPAWPIDWILASEKTWGWVSAEIDTTQHAGIYPSDHFPITASHEKTSIASQASHPPKWPPILFEG